MVGVGATGADGAGGAAGAKGAQSALPPGAVAALRGELPRVASIVVSEIMREVPAYNVPFKGRMGRIIERAVVVSLEGFVRVAGGARASGPDGIGVGITAARELGQAEARRGRPVEALLAAYRVGARVSWREMSGVAVDNGVDARTLSGFAGLVFDYIDELSAASVAGHSNEVASVERARLVQLDRLTRALLTGAAEGELERGAAAAGWSPPRTLTAVLVPHHRLTNTAAVLDPRTLTLEEDLPPHGEVPGPTGQAVLLVPDAGGRSRRHLLELLDRHAAVVGPVRPWQRAVESYRRALRAVELAGSGGPLDTDLVLPELVLRADPEALADLREGALAPFAQVSESTAQRLADTLRAWLLLQGRRELVAEELHVHPQTVRYRMNQVRDLLGEDLTDPDRVLALVLALGRRTPAD